MSAVTEPEAVSFAAAARLQPAEGPPTAAGAWRAAGETMRLPSGNVARLRRPQLFTWLAEGEIPNPLRDAVVELAGEGEGQPVSPEERLRALFWIVARCFVAPVVVTDREPEDGELHIRQVEDADKLALIEWAMEEVAQLAGFRPDGAGAAAGGDGAGVRAEAEPDARPA